MNGFKVFASGRSKNQMPEEQMAKILACLCDFAGYECEKIDTPQAVYPYTKTSEILRKQRGFVGTMGGLKGFAEQSADSLKEGEYQYCANDLDRIDKSRWALDCFKEIYYWKVDGKGLSAEIRHELESEGIEIQSS
jgi:hypothetical protein